MCNLYAVDPPIYTVYTFKILLNIFIMSTNCWLWRPPRVLVIIIYKHHSLQSNVSFYLQENHITMNIRDYNVITIYHDCNGIINTTFCCLNHRCIPITIIIRYLSIISSFLTCKNGTDGSFINKYLTNNYISTHHVYPWYVAVFFWFNPYSWW